MAIVPKIRIRRAEKLGKLASIKFLQTKGEYPADWKFVLFPDKEFEKEVKAAEIKYKVKIIPTLAFTQTGINTSVGFAEIKASNAASILQENNQIDSANISASVQQ